MDSRSLITGISSNLDTTSLASLTAGNVAATDGLARLIGEKEFSVLFHEGERDNIHISIVGKRVILVVIFDERSSLGLVRLRVKKASTELENVFNRILEKVEREKEAGAADLNPPLLKLQTKISTVYSANSRSRVCFRRSSMTFINYASREINCKIVYYGPGLCGKTTNIQYIYDRTNPKPKEN